MSIPANKADNKTPAYDIQLKRTDKSFEDDDIANGTLEYGEALYGKSENLLAVGDGETKVSSLKVTRLVRRALAPLMTFYKKYSEPEFTSDPAVVTLWKGGDSEDTDKELLVKNKIWTPVNSSGIPCDSADNACQVNALNSDWYEVTESGMSGTKLNPSSTAVPRAQKIAVKGVTKDMTIQISNVLSNEERKDPDKARSSRKCFSTITDVESYNGGIIVYCSTKYYPGCRCYI